MKIKQYNFLIYNTILNRKVVNAVFDSKKTTRVTFKTKVQKCYIACYYIESHMITATLQENQTKIIFEKIILDLMQIKNKFEI